MSSFILRIATRAVGAPAGFVANEIHTPAQVPRAGLVVNALLSMITIAVLAVCLSKLSGVEGSSYVY